MKGIFGNMRLGGAALVVTLMLATPAEAAPFVPDIGAEAYRSVLFVGGDLDVARDCAISGDLHGNAAVSLTAGTIVDGSLSAVATVALNGATVTGSVTSPVSPRPLPQLPTAAEARALADRVFEGDHLFPDGTVIDDVVFVAGQARFEGSVNGQGTVIAGVEIRFDNVTPGHPVDLDESTWMSFVSLGGIWVGMDQPLRCILVAADSVEIHKELELEGLVVAGGSLAILKDSVISYRPPDQDPPVISNLTPASGSVVPFRSPEIKASYSDDFSGVDPESVVLAVDGIDRTTEAVISSSGIVFAPSESLADGLHQIQLSVSDLAGNVAEAVWEFTVGDFEAPTIVIEEPLDGTLTNHGTIDITGTVTDNGTVASVLIDGAPLALDGDRFTTTVLLEEEGFTVVLIVAADSFGNQAAAAVGVTFDAEPPQLTLTRPAEGQLVNGDTIRVTGETSDRNGVAAVTVDGEDAALIDDRFDVQVRLMQEGSYAIVVTATDHAGNSTELHREVVRFSLPEVAITSPADLNFVAETTVDVGGTVSSGVVEVAVNGVPATVDGTSFLAAGVPLIEGGNTVTATATDENGHVATDTIHLVRDLTPPRVAIYHPAAGSVVREETVSVSGLINDIVPGTVNAAEATVTVNGSPAEVVNRSFAAHGVPLTPGENVIVAEAVDASGNVSEDRVAIAFAQTSDSSLRIVSGNHQSAPIGTTLPQPLIVELVDEAGHPVAGRAVIFTVRGNDGSFDGGHRQIAVTSDGAGRTQAVFTLGTRAGVANQAVEASAVGFDGPAVFTFSALPGEPELIVVDAGGLQVGVAGQQVPRPLIAAVVDSGNNRLQGVPVLFEVSKGTGRFADGSESTVVPTDSDGRAIATFTLDPEEGIANNAVSARIQGLSEGPSTTFVASGRAAGPPAATSISGVVLDNTNVPVPGATLRVKHTGLTAVTDQEGQFRIQGAPVGAVKLIVDGSTVSRPGTWPDLEFDLVTIAGRDNTVNMPIFLLPLDLGSAIFVDETRGGALTPEVPGFSLEILPGSVTFPGGGRSGLVSVTVVHSDKVPMTPNFGQQPRLIVTIQPAGARFEPPARLTLPNLDGLTPGRVTEMYSFDHDLGHFVSIGPATVSDDGTVIVSNPGVGIVKAGWHCGGDPEAGVCLHDCPQCSICEDPPCECSVPVDLCTACEPPGSACDGEFACKSGRHLIPKICDQIDVTEGTATSQTNSCDGVPDMVEGMCGSAVRVVYEEVTHSCDDIDMEGAVWHETMEWVEGDCGGSGIQTRRGEVHKGNRLAPPGQVFADYLWLCKFPHDLHDGFHCSETWTQTMYIDDCPYGTATVTFDLLYQDGECLSATSRSRN